MAGPRFLSLGKTTKSGEVVSVESVARCMSVRLVLTLLCCERKADFSSFWKTMRRPRNSGVIRDGSGPVQSGLRIKSWPGKKSFRAVNESQEKWNLVRASIRNRFKKGSNVCVDVVVGRRMQKLSPSPSSDWNDGGGSMVVQRLWQVSREGWEVRSESGCLIMYSCALCLGLLLGSATKP